MKASKKVQRLERELVGIKLLDFEVGRILKGLRYSLICMVTYSCHNNDGYEVATHIEHKWECMTYQILK